MRGSAMIVVVIFLSAIVMFIFPLMATASQQDEIERTTIEAATQNFVNRICANTWELTQDNLNQFEYEISGKTGNMYAVDLKAEIRTEDPSKKTSGSVMIDGNKYYTMYNSQILQQLPIKFKEGDNISVTVTRVNRSIFEQLRDIAYHVTGNDNKTIASASGIVTANGY